MSGNKGVDTGHISHNMLNRTIAALNWAYSLERTHVDILQDGDAELLASIHTYLSCVSRKEDAYQRYFASGGVTNKQKKDVPAGLPVSGQEHAKVSPC
jgi:hypothetical protein